jgi:hypothetical protein
MLILVLLALVLACSDDKVSKTRIQLEDLPSDKKVASAPRVSQQPLVCPSAGVTPLQPSAPGTGDHKVFLSWNASKPSKQAPGAAEGYCLYRGTKRQGDAKKDPRCPDCEQISVFPITGTSCVDDLVKDGATYYYVAIAIDRNRNLSTTSNEIRVDIPGTKAPVGPPPAGNYPSCRIAPAGNGIPASH